MIAFTPERARRTLLISLVSVGMGFTVLFPILAPLGREIGLSEVQITFIIGASALMAGASLAVSAREQGAVAGVAGSRGPLGFALGPLLGGLLYQFSPTLPYAVAAGIQGLERQTLRCNSTVISNRQTQQP